MARSKVEESVGIKAITVKQPWAKLIMLGLKRVENRPTSMEYRGRIAIHVAKTRADESELESALALINGDETRALVRKCWEENQHAGCVIGTVELVDIVRDSDSPWAIPGKFHWVLRQPRLFPASDIRAARGQLGVWNYADNAPSMIGDGVSAE